MNHLKALFTDADWVADLQKIIGFILCVIGIIIIIVCALKWVFGEASGFGMGLIGTGGGMITIKGINDKPTIQPFPPQNKDI